MRRFNINHQTNYDFSGFVELQPHTLRLRPREGHELRLESSLLTISPVPLLRWHRDVEGNSCAIAVFSEMANRLSIKSEVVIQQYDEAPMDFLIDKYAINYPFQYQYEDQISLSPYMNRMPRNEDNALGDWLQNLQFWNEGIQTTALLTRLNFSIHQGFRYERREEEGVQTAKQTLLLGSGSCRDFANLFIQAARKLGMAARFVSGYLNSDGNTIHSGATHAWAEVFLPGAGWKGFDPTAGLIVGPDHIAVAVAREPYLVPPVSGSFIGPLGATMSVAVEVSELR
jgi:transglutaminase-like putative cysteine protease